MYVWYKLGQEIVYSICVWYKLGQEIVYSICVWYKLGQEIYLHLQYICVV